MARPFARKRRSPESDGSPSSAAKRNKGKPQQEEELDKENEDLQHPASSQEEEVVSPSGDDAASVTEETEEAEEEEEEEEQEEYVEAAAAAADDEELVEDGDEEEAMAVEEEEEEEEITDASAARGRRRSSASSSTSNKPTEAGIIKQIYVENFMCHKCLRVDLNRNINFIHGQNGSGKSAVLAAIQICLGAAARATNRARNLKDLIRRDAASGAMPSQAKIKVTILNQGSDGYKRELYGDTITIEKIIPVQGQGGFRLYSANGKKISDKKSDLVEMLDTLNIQVDNPVAVLDQDEAKKFLMGKSEDKYAFFMKATELERVDQTYASTLETVEELTFSNESQRKTLATQHEDMLKLKQKWEEHQELGKLELKLQRMNTEFGWALYNEMDDRYNEALENLENFREKAKKYQADLSQAEEALSNPEEENESKRAKIDSLLQEVEEQTVLKRELETELRDTVAPLKKIETELKNIKKRKKHAVNQKKMAEQSLQQARDEIIAKENSAESELARRTALLKKTEEELAEARSKIDELKQEASMYYRKYEEIEPHVQEASNRIDGLKGQISGVQNKLHSLQSSSGDSLAMLGPRVTKVAQLVEKARKQNKFQGQVTGPIGSFLKVAPGMQQYAAVAEHALGIGVLDRFIVTNDHDGKVLRQIRNQAGCSQDCGIYQIHPDATRSRFDTPGPPDADGIETVASVFSIDNVTVFNCLVDNARIEQKAVALDRKLSERALKIQNGNHIQIRGHVKEVYFLPKGDHWTTRNGSMATFSNEKQLRNTIGVDKSAAIEDARREEAQIKEELRVKKQEEAKLHHEHSGYQREWNRAKKAAQKIESRIHQLTEKHEAINEEMESMENETIDTSEIENEIKELDQQLEKLVESEQTLTAQHEETKPRAREIRSRMDEISSRVEKVLDDVKAAENELSQKMETQSQQQSQIEKKRARVQKYLNCVSQHEENIKSKLADRDSALKKARKLHFRYLQRQKAGEKDESEGATAEAGEEEEVSQGASPGDSLQDPTPEDLEAIEPKTAKHEPAYYEPRIKNAQKKIEKERARRNVSREDPAAAFEKYTEAKKKYSKAVNVIKETEAHIEELQMDIKVRRKRWQRFRKHLSHFTGMKFNEMLIMNKYSGTLDFDHETAALDLAVVKGTAESQGETKDVKALSGGERSYTTMCLLLALGETLETPFRVLDEFDVFMDPEVRKLTIKQLVHVALKMKHRQFIFITPQDLSSIQTNSEVSIHKLTNPFRHNIVGGPSQQTLSFASQGS